MGSLPADNSVCDKKRNQLCLKEVPQGSALGPLIQQQIMTVTCLHTHEAAENHQRDVSGKDRGAFVRVVKSPSGHLRRHLNEALFLVLVFFSGY